MPIIKHKQFIKAPIEKCFDLARNIDIHMKTTSKTKEKAVGGVTTGLMEAGDIITFEAVHFGIKQRLTSKVVYMDRPNKFIDIMLKGAFKSFTHTHQFIEENNGTLTIDLFEYVSPLGSIGVIADQLFLEKYMKEFISSKAKELKRIAENI